MVYTHSNTDRAAVFDVDTKEQFHKVLAVNASSAWIDVVEEPLRSNDRDEVAARRIRFRSIHPIFAGGDKPCMFHCYGRKVTNRELIADLVALTEGK